MSETVSKLRIALVVASALLAVPVLAGTASADDYYYGSGYSGGYYYPYARQDSMSGHVEAERRHMSAERHHLRHGQQELNEALRYGDFGRAWALYEHVQQERRHLQHERRHVDDED